MVSSVRVSLSVFLCAFAAVSFAQAPKSSPQLLVATRAGTLESVQAATRDLGKVVGRDRSSGLYRLSLKPGISQHAAKEKLLGTKSVSLAVGAGPVDRFRDESVNDHVAYLEQVAKKLHPEEKRHDAPDLDWWESYRYWLHDRVNRNGVLDRTPFMEAAQHRDAMPAAQLGGIQPDNLAGNWSFVGPNNLDIPYQIYYGVRPLSGRVNAIAVDPTNSNVVYIGGAVGGVWKTTNGGVNWTPLSDKWPFLQVSTLAIDPSNHLTIYAGTGDFHGENGPFGIGIMKSLDGGSTWTNYGNATFNGIAVSKIVIDPSNTSVLVATAGRLTQRGGGIFRSINGGQTWTEVDPSGGSGYYWMCDLDVSAPDSSGNRTWWATGEASGGAPLLTSTNHGLTWTVLASSPFGSADHYATAVACSKTAHGTAYLLEPDTFDIFQGLPPSDDHIWKTTDGGLHWVDIVAGFPNGISGSAYYNWSQGEYDFHIHTSTTTVGTVTKDAVYVGLITISMSPDAGATWIDLGKTYTTDSMGNPTALVHQDQHTIAVDPTNPNIVYVGCDGGIFKSVYNVTSKASTFTPWNKLLGITQFYHITTHPTDPTKVMGGAQDNAGPASTGDLNNWNNPGAGDGASVAYDLFNPNIVYSGTQGLGINRTTDDWQTTNSDISVTTNFNLEPINFIPPFTLSTNANSSGHSTLYAGTDHLWKWDELNTWAGDLGNTVLTTASLRTIAVCPNDGNRIYVGGDDGQLWMTTDAGSTWKRLDGGAFGFVSAASPGAPVVTISPSPSNASDILVGIAQTGGNGNLYQCSNTLAATPVWSNAVSGSGSTSLPSIPVNVVKRDPFVPGSTFYVGNDVGVFMTTNTGSSWTNMTTPLGLPNCQVNDLSVNVNTGFLYAGTFGRGMWKINLTNPNLPTLTKFTTPSAVVSGNPFTASFTLSTAAPAAGAAIKVTTDTSAFAPPATVTIPSGATSKSFTVTTYSLQLTSPVTRHLTGSYNGVTITDAILIYPASVTSLTLNPTTVTGAGSTTATITLNAPAAAHYVLNVTSTDPTHAAVPSTVTVPQGAKMATFKVTTAAPASGETVTITVSRTNTRSATFTLNP